MKLVSILSKKDIYVFAKVVKNVETDRFLRAHAKKIRQRRTARNAC